MKANNLLLKDFVPFSNLGIKRTEISQPGFLVIDSHNHLGENFGGGWINRSVKELLEVLDQSGVQVLVDLDGGWGDEILNKHLDHFKSAAPDRFLHFGGVNWEAWQDHGNNFSDWAAKELRNQVRRGAEGLKIWKVLGLKIKDHNKKLVPIDDLRLKPIWATAAELGIPVTIHIADPVAFFRPLNEHNERWEELIAHPDWHFPSPPNP